MKFGALTFAATAMLALATLPALAQQATIAGFSNGSAYLHAGPGNDFPVVAHISPGANLTITGCSQGFVWCDVASEGNRGWMEGRFLDSRMNEQTVNIAEFGRIITVPTVVYDQRSDGRRIQRASPLYSNMVPQTPAESRSTRYNSVDE